MVNVQTLQKYSLFGGLMAEQIEAILPHMKEENFGSGETIIAEGKPNDRIYFLIEGKVEVTKGDVFLSTFCEGEAFGEMEVLDVMPAVATIKAMMPVKTLSVSNRGLREIYKMDVKVFSLMIMNLARDLSRRMRRMDERLASESKPILI